MALRSPFRPFFLLGDSFLGQVVDGREVVALLCFSDGTKGMSDSEKTMMLLGNSGSVNRSQLPFTRRSSDWGGSSLSPVRLEKVFPVY